VLVREERDSLKAEIEGRVAGVAAVTAAGVAQAVALVGPTAAAAEARRAALLRRRQDTLSIVGEWLRKCADDAAA
jgi:hypothetical protein